MKFVPLSLICEGMASVYLMSQKGVSLNYSSEAPVTRSYIKDTLWACDAAQAAKKMPANFALSTHGVVVGPFCPAAGHAGCSAICGHRPNFLRCIWSRGCIESLKKGFP